MNDIELEISQSHEDQFEDPSQSDYRTLETEQSLAQTSNAEANNNAMDLAEDLADQSTEPPPQKEIEREQEPKDDKPRSLSGERQVRASTSEREREKDRVSEDRVRDRYKERERERDSYRSSRRRSPSPPRRRSRSPLQARRSPPPLSGWDRAGPSIGWERGRNRNYSRDRRSWSRERRSGRGYGGRDRSPVEPFTWGEKQKRERRVYVGNLTYGVRLSHLKDFMREAGELVYAEIMTSPQGVSKGCGIVEYRYEEDARRAIRRMHDLPLMGRKVFIREDREHEFHSHHPPPPPPANYAPRSAAGRQLYVGNLPYSTSWQDLKDLFRQVGPVERADIQKDASGRSRGSGIVVLVNQDDVGKAIARFHDQTWNGRRLEVREDRYANNSSRYNGSGTEGGGGSSFPNPYMAAFPGIPGGFTMPLPFPAGGFPRGAGPAKTVSQDGRSRSRSRERVDSPRNVESNLPENPDNVFSPSSFVPPFGEGAPAFPAFNPLMAAAAYGGFPPGAFPGGPGGFPPIFPGPGGAMPTGSFGGHEPGNQIYVRNLPYTTTDQDLVDLFNSFGEIERANIQMANGRSRGAGIVQFSSIDAAEAAVLKLNGYVYGGRTLEVRFDRPGRP